MTKIILDRLVIEEAGPNPERLAQAIHLQLRHSEGPIPVEEIAAGLDIVQIQYETLENFEGALLTTPERNIGAILINASSRRQRRRFTLGHELGHFLNVWHEPNEGNSFMCTSRDLATGNSGVKRALSDHERQEVEANRFAVELLAPKQRVVGLSGDEPRIDEVLRIATQLDLSKETAARRYVNLHPASVAVVFTENGAVRYCVECPTCPKLGLRKGQMLFELGAKEPGQITSQQMEIDLPVDRGQVRPTSAWAETYHQNQGFAFSLLTFDSDDPDERAEDAYDRFFRL